MNSIGVGDGSQGIGRALQADQKARGRGFGHTYIARDMRRPGNPLCVVKHLKPASTDPEFIRKRAAYLILRRKF